MSVCFVSVTGSGCLQGPQRGKPHQHHDRQADRRPQRAGEGVATCAAAPQVLLSDRTVPALSVLVLKDRISLENKECYRKTPGIRDEEAFCAFSGAIDC